MKNKLRTFRITYTSKLWFWIFDKKWLNKSDVKKRISKKYLDTLVSIELLK